MEQNTIKSHDDGFKQEFEDQVVTADSKAEPEDLATLEAEEKVILKRIDLILLPLMFLTYLLQAMDKSSLGNTSILGIIPDAHLVGQNFSWLTSVFFFGYLGASYPVSVMFVKFPLAKIMAISITVWGVVLACHGASSDFAGLATCRFLLGVLESTISPGFSLMTGLWYKPSEHATRHGVWFAGTSTGAMCSALIAYGCAHITGGPLARWRWLFIASGVITIIWGVILLLSLPDSPTTAWFLTKTQRPIANRRPQRLLHSFKTNKWSKPQFIEALKDPKTWLLFIIISITSLTNSIIANFSALIVSGLGFSTLDTLLLTLPLASWQFILILVSVYAASKFRKSRIIVMILGNILSLVGVLLIRQLPKQNIAGRYVGAVLLYSNTATVPLLLSLIASNVAGFTKKSTVNAVFFVGYCAGNIAGPQFFIIAEAPSYPTAYTAIVAIYCLTIGFLALKRFYLVWANKRRDKTQGVVIEVEPRAGTMSAEERADHEATTQIIEESDWDNKNFRYYL